jgi:Xaa-Pro aminopeptidase
VPVPFTARSSFHELGTGKMQTLIKEKITQAADILNELDIDVWLTFVRETIASVDPVLELIYGSDLTWQTAILIQRTGKHTIILGNFEAETATRLGAYQNVIPYHQSIREPLIETLLKINPNRIAINYSLNDSHSDGLSHGMFQLLQEYLSDIGYANKLVSAEKIIAAVRGRKTPAEIQRIRTAVQTTEIIYRKTFEMLKTGISEIDVANFMLLQVESLGLETAWQRENCPAVNSGPLSPVGHSGPTEIIIEPGHLVHFDFGVKQAGYCSDIQRMAYICRSGESKPPDEVLRGFETVVAAIGAAFDSIQPGTTGLEIDQIAREMIIKAGYPEYMYATGHHLGRTVHDGAGILGPLWERYGETPRYPLEAGHVYTLEPGLKVDGYGYIGLEEDILVTPNGAEFISEPQTGLILIQSD